MVNLKNHLKIVIVGILVCFFGGCGQTFSPSLKDIDKMLSVDNEKGEKMLDSFRNTSPKMSVANQIYCKLLMLKADDKAYRPIVGQKENIDSLVCYFQKNGDNNILAEAYFYAGRVYFEIGDKPESLKYYHKASEYVSADDYALQGDIYCQMANVYYYTDLHNEALKVLRLAYRADSLCGNTRNMLYDLRDMGENYYGLDHISNAEFYFHKGLDLAIELKDSFMTKEFHHNLASVYLKKNNLGKALFHVEKYIHDMADFHDKSGMLVTALAVYTQLNLNTSIDSCRNLILEEGNIFSKQYAIENAIMSDLKLQKTNMAKLFALYKEYTDSVSKESNSMAVKKAEQTYNYEIKESENRNLRLTNMFKNIGLAMLVTIIVLAILFFILKVKSMKQQQMILKFKLDKYKNLQEKTKIKSVEKLTREQAMIQNSSVYTILLQSIEHHQFHLTEEHWKELNNLVTSVYIDFEKNLQSFLSVTSQEYKICLLIKLGISPSNIARFMYLTKEAISAARRRMYQKTFKRKGTPSDWDKIVLSL